MDKRYRTGRSIALVDGHRAAMLDPDVSEHLVSSLWGALASGHDLTADLSVLARQGFAGLPSFALVSIEQERVHGFVRGEIEVIVETPTGLVSYDGRTVGTWTELVVDGVRKVAILSADDTSTDTREYPLRAGVVLATELVIEVHPPVLRETVTAAEAVPAEGAALSSFAPADQDVSQTRANSGIEDTGFNPRNSPEDFDGRTILSSELVEIRKRLATWPDDQVPGPFPLQGAGNPLARMILSNGMVVGLDRAVLIGRAPIVSRSMSGTLARVITVESPHRDISRTHAELEVIDNKAYVRDLHSTNGVYVLEPGAPARRLAAGEPVELAPEAVVDIGEGITFTVELISQS